MNEWSDGQRTADGGENTLHIIAISFLSLSGGADRLPPCRTTTQPQPQPPIQTHPKFPLLPTARTLYEADVAYMCTYQAPIPKPTTTTAAEANINIIRCARCDEDAGGRRPEVWLAPYL